DAAQLLIKYYVLTSGIRINFNFLRTDKRNSGVATSELVFIGHDQRRTQNVDMTIMQDSRKTVDYTNELGNKGRFWLMVELTRGSDLFDVPCVHHANPVSHH